MKSLLSVFAMFIIFATSTAFANDDSKYDIRNVTWDMTKEQVIKAEIPNNPIVLPDDKIIYNDIVAQKPVMIVYMFTDNKLNTVSYLFKDFTDTKDAKNFLSRVKGFLSQKYTRIDRTKDIISDEKLSQRDKQALLTLEKTLGSAFIEYENDRTYVLVMNSSENKKEPQVQVSYMEKNYAKKQKELAAEEQKAKEEEYKKQNERDAAQF